MVTDAPYAAAWDEYRRRWRTVYWRAGGSIACCLLALHLRHTSVYAIFALPFVPLMWAAMFLNWRLWFWLCPRCKQWFFIKRGEFIFGDGIFVLASWRCRHCRLPKWAVRDPD